MSPTGSQRTLEGDDGALICENCGKQYVLEIDWQIPYSVLPRSLRSNQ